MKAIYLIVLILFSSTLLAKECDLTQPVKRFLPQYATHFSIDYFKHFKIIHVDKDHYYLSDNSHLGCELPMLKISTPVKKVVMMSTTYLPALVLLKKEKTLIGFQGKNYIVSPAFNLNLIQDIAYRFNPEYLLGLKSDLIMGYDSNLVSPGQTEVFKSLRIPVVINKDFEERSPLARAEWLIFIASFYNEDDKGIEIFKAIEARYNQIKQKNLKVSKKASVLVGEIQNGYWVTCGARSDLAQIIEDAGGELVIKRQSSETQKISLEELSENKKNHDIWLTHNFWRNRKDLSDAIKTDKRYMLIKAKNIYNNNLITNAANASDYWETGMQRPDLLLEDLSSLFHPENYRDHVLRWYRKL